jgi:membrane-associated phospholipid phosphatase
MIDIHAPPQPSSPREAQHVLPLGALGTYLLLGGGFCVLATMAFAWLAKGIFADRFVAIDDGVISWLHSEWGPNSDQVMLTFTTLGDAIVIGIFIALAAFGLWRAGRWIDAVGLILAAGGAGALNEVLKLTFQRVRPSLFPGPFHLTTYSFPSGHAMGSLACYGMLAFVGIRLLRSRPSKLLLGLAAVLLVLGVGLSRVYFGVHYPTDVVGGYIAGAIWLAFTIGVVQAAEWYAQRRGAQHAAKPRAWP